MIIKGYWHVIALSVGVCILSFTFKTQLLFIGWLIWLILLYKTKRLGKLHIIVSLTFYLFFSLYIPSLNSDFDSAIKEPFPKESTYSGRITNSIQKSPKKIEFHFQMEGSNETLLALYFPTESELYSNPNIEQLKAGATCQITGNLILPEESTNPGQFNYREYLKTKGISYQLLIDSLGDVHCEGASFLNRLDQVRQGIHKMIFKTYGKDTASWMVALVLGDDSYLREETIELFRNWGISHLLAISGLHVGLIVSLIYFLMLKTGILTKEKAQWVMLLFLPCYAIIAGGEPSVLRASLMVWLVIVLSKWKLNIKVSDLISIVFLLLVLFDPYVVHHIGFQFSFIVTFAIILSGKWLKEPKSLFFQMLKISFVSQMVILPLQFIYFSSFQPLSILLNVIIVPYFSFFVIPGMFLMALLSPLPILPVIFDKLFSFIHFYFITFIERLNNIVNYPWVMGSFPELAVLLYYVLFILFMIYASKNALKRAFKHGILITILITFVMLRPYISPYGSITMFDIGQGDAFVIELPYRRGVILSEAGATFSYKDMEFTDKVYKQILRPYLHARGIQSIDAIFISHEDMDHMGSVDYLTEEFNVNEIIISPFYQLPEETADLWRENNVRIRKVKQQEKVIINDVPFNILAPRKDMGSDNENSLVIETNLGGKSWLFTGDAGKVVEKDIMTHFPNLSIDVLKVGHHGSKTSTGKDFVEHINPRYGLLSVGKNNTYGHPSPDVIKTLEEAGVEIFRTDEQGAIIYRFKDEEGTFYKHLP